MCAGISKRSLGILFIKMNSLNCFAISLAGSLILSSSSPGDTTFLFDEHFDNSPPYKNGGLLPMDESKMHYGHWHSEKSSGNASMTITGEKFASAPWALALRVGNDSGTSSVAGAFGGLDSVATDSLIRWEISFYLESSTLDKAPFFAIRDADGKNLSLLYIDNGGLLRPNNEDSGVSITQGQWYRLEVILPANAAALTDPRYAMNIYDLASNEIIYSGSLRLFGAPPFAASSYATVNMSATSNVLYLDDWRVTTVSTTPTDIP